MKTIIIGTDEIILWIRKNGLLPEITNDKLGKKILNLIVGIFSGFKIGDDIPCVWATDDDKITNKYNLPRTAAQYEVKLSGLSEIYEHILEWPSQ